MCVCECAVFECVCVRVCECVCINRMLLLKLLGSHAERLTREPQPRAEADILPRRPELPRRRGGALLRRRARSLGKHPPCGRVKKQRRPSGRAPRGEQGLHSPRARLPEDRGHRRVPEMLPHGSSLSFPREFQILLPWGMTQ